MRRTLYAVVLAAGYAALAAAYILVSSSFAAGEARSVEELERFEMMKGIVFVGVTSAFVLAGGWVLARRLEGDAEKILHREMALVATERRGMAGLVASSVAHDANNVLTVMMGDIEDLRDQADPALVDRLESSATRLAGLHRRLLRAAQQKISDERKAVDLAATVGESLELLRRSAKVKGCHLSLRAEGEMAGVAYPVLIQQIVNNLVLNAGEATGGQGAVEVALRRDGQDVVLEVHDDGPGVPAGRREGLFDALVTTKSDGSGLGLFSVKACAEAHGGAVEVLESPLGGACFRVRLPVTSEART